MTLAFVTRVVLSAIIIAVIATVSKRSPAVGALVASLPLVSTLAILWLWHDTRDTALIADFIGTTLIYWLPSIPMFVLMPWMLRHGTGFWLSLAAGIAVTFVSYFLTTIIAARYGIKL